MLEGYLQGHPTKRKKKEKREHGRYYKETCIVVQCGLLELFTKYVRGIKFLAAVGLFLTLNVTIVLLKTNGENFNMM